MIPWSYVWKLYAEGSPAAELTLHAWIFSQFYPGVYRVGLRRWQLNEPDSERCPNEQEAIQHA